MSTENSSLFTKNAVKPAWSGAINRFMLIQLAIVTLVIIGHSSTLPQGPSHSEILYMFGYDLSWWGVNGLFCLSGFMAAKTLSKHNISATLLTPRILRVFPVLAVYTLIVVLILYPLLGTPMDSPATLIKNLAIYAFAVMSCVNPSRPLPGLLDDANYACIIQGTIWTFTWGLVAFTGASALRQLGLLSKRGFILALTIAAIFLRIGTVYAKVNYPDLIPDVFLPASRLSTMFLIGLLGYAYRDYLARSWRWVGLGVVITFVQFQFLMWTPFIEITGSLTLGYAIWLLISNSYKQRPKNNKLQYVAISAYIFHWPIAQLFLLGFPDISPTGLIFLTLPSVMLFSIALSIALDLGAGFASQRHTLIVSN